MQGFVNAFNPFEDQTGVGTVPSPGSCEVDPLEQTFTITGGGAGIGGERDGFHFVWRRMRGNFIATARAGFAGPGGNPQRILGWMARSSLQPGSPFVSAGLTGGDRLSLGVRPHPGAPAQMIRSDLTGADVIQLERKGNAFTMSAAKYGDPYNQVQSGEIDLGDELYVGLFVCSGETGSVEKATFQDVRLVATGKDGFDPYRDPFGSRLEILDIASGRRKMVYCADTIFEAPNWTRDGRALIINSLGRLYRFDLPAPATGAPTLIDTGDVIQNNNDHVLSFDGSMLAISSSGGPGGDQHSRIYTVPAWGGKPKLITPNGPSYLHGWSPDGQNLVYTALRNGDYDIYRMPAGGGGEEEQLTSAPGLDDGPEYTPDGSAIYFNSVRSGRMQIWRMQADGSRQEQLTGDDYNNWFPHISPDGKQVVFLTYLVDEVAPSDHPPAKRVYIRLAPVDALDRPKVIAYLFGGQGTLNVPSWSPDGKKIAFVSNTVPFSNSSA